MLLMYSIRVADCPPVWERVKKSTHVLHDFLSIYVFVLHSSLIEMSESIALFTKHCLSVDSKDVHVWLPFQEHLMHKVHTVLLLLQTCSPRVGFFFIF